jgi:hypothetical protein
MTNSIGRMSDMDTDAKITLELYEELMQARSKLHKYEEILDEIVKDAPEIEPEWPYSDNHDDSRDYGSNITYWYFAQKIKKIREE